jgi:hypothetical protein
MTRAKVLGAFDHGLVEYHLSLSGRQSLMTEFSSALGLGSLLATDTP